MPVIPPSKIRVLDAATDKREAELKDLFAAYLAGEIAQATWQIAAAEMVKQGYLQSALLGANTEDIFDNEDMLADIEDDLTDEMDYLDGFFQDVEDDREDESVSMGRIGNRLAMYAGAARTFFFVAFMAGLASTITDDRVMLVRRICAEDEASCQDCKALAEMGWRHPGTLPYPGKMARCGGHCRCGWETGLFERNRVDEDGLLSEYALGGPTSGNYGHAGVPGQRGGSAARVVGIRYPTEGQVLIVDGHWSTQELEQKYPVISSDSDPEYQAALRVKADIPTVDIIGEPLPEWEGDNERVY